MYFTVKVVNVAGRLSVTLPSEVVAGLKAHENDTLTFAKTIEGFVLTALSPDAGRQLDASRQIMRENYDVLRELAKS